MKNIFIFIFVFINVNVYSQNNITVATQGSSTFIEAGQSYNYAAYRLGSEAKSVLVQSLKTALEWYDLNKSHRKSFTKEINRFKVIKKDVYEFHGYVKEFTDNAKVMFTGYSNGNSEVRIDIEGLGMMQNFILINDRESIKNFLNVLQGKSGNNEVDNIFKN